MDESENGGKGGRDGATNVIRATTVSCSVLHPRPLVPSRSSRALGSPSNSFRTQPFVRGPHPRLPWRAGFEAPAALCTLDGVVSATKAELERIVAAAIAAQDRGQQQQLPRDAPFVWENLALPVQTSDAAAVARGTPLQRALPALSALALSSVYAVDASGAGPVLACHLLGAPQLVLIADGSTQTLTLARCAVRADASKPTALPPMASASLRGLLAHDGWATLVQGARLGSDVGTEIFAWAASFAAVDPKDSLGGQKRVLQLVGTAADRDWRLGTLEQLEAGAAARGLGTAYVWVKQVQRPPRPRVQAPVPSSPPPPPPPLEVVQHEHVAWATRKWARVRIACHVEDGTAAIAGSPAAASGVVNLFGAFPERALSPQAAAGVRIHDSAALAWLRTLCGPQVGGILRTLHRTVTGAAPPGLVVCASIGQRDALWRLCQRLLGTDRCQDRAPLAADIWAETLMLRLQAAQVSPFLAYLGATGDGGNSPGVVRKLRRYPGLSCAVTRQVVSAIIKGVPGDVSDVSPEYAATVVLPRRREVPDAPELSDADMAALFHIVRELDAYEDAVDAQDHAVAREFTMDVFRDEVLPQLAELGGLDQGRIAKNDLAARVQDFCDSAGYVLLAEARKTSDALAEQLGATYCRISRGRPKPAAAWDLTAVLAAHGVSPATAPHDAEDAAAGKRRREEGGPSPAGPASTAGNGTPAHAGDSPMTGKRQRQGDAPPGRAAAVNAAAQPASTAALALTESRALAPGAPEAADGEGTTPAVLSNGGAAA